MMRKQGQNIKEELSPIVPEQSATALIKKYVLSNIKTV